MLEWLRKRTLIEWLTIIAVTLIFYALVSGKLSRTSAAEIASKDALVFHKLPIAEQSLKLVGKDMSYAKEAGWVNKSDPVHNLQANFGKAPDGSDWVFITSELSGKIWLVLPDDRNSPSPSQ